LKYPHLIGRAEIGASLDYRAAADLLEAALSAGLDPESQPPRAELTVGAGSLLVMPALAGGHATVKLVSVGGEPRIQGLAVVFGARTLEPLALIDARALTELRTPAVSLLAARRLVRGDVRRLVVFGRGPQGRAHAAALGGELGAGDVVELGSNAPATAVRTAIREADLICCATTARSPLFDGAAVSREATVIAIGSHERDARELDAALVRRSTVAVEARHTALAEAGDLVMAGIRGEEMITLRELVTGAALPGDGPRIFKSTGMGWQDAVLADAMMAAVS
jgi:ornithine cyclodeaminase/alanine dehydrogenase-like protein (mu-crystallin family)